MKQILKTSLPKLFFTLIFLLLSAKKAFADMPSVNPYYDSPFSFPWIIILPIIITILIELPIFLLFGFRSKKEIITVILMNIVSVPVVGFISFFSLSLGVYIILLAELIAILFEFLVLGTFSENKSKKRIALVVILANISSVIIGLGIVYLYFASFSHRTILPGLHPPILPGPQGLHPVDYYQ